MNWQCMQCPPNRLAVSGASVMQWRRALWFTGCEKPGGPEPGSIQDINIRNKCQHQKKGSFRVKKKQNPAGFDTLNTRTILDVETGTMKISGCHSQNQAAFKVSTVSQGVNTRIRLAIYQDVISWPIFSTHSMNYITKRLLICSWPHRSLYRP